MFNRNGVLVEGPTAFIQLTDKHGKCVAEALVDAADAHRVLDFGRWRKARCGYVYSFTVEPLTGRRKDVALHRFLLSPPEGMVVDHINHNPLDNRRENLRVLTRAENMQNRRGPVKGKQDPYRNVYRQSKGNGFVVRVSGRYFGAFRTLEEANEVAHRARRRLLTYSNS